MHYWFNQPHIQEFYSLRAWTLEEVEKKLMPYIQQTVPVYGYIISYQLKPIGYLQYYSVVDYPWPEQELSDSIAQQAAGLDFFIGESAFVGRGFGGQIIEQCLDQLIWPKFSYCLVDPDIRNIRSFKMFKKNGFLPHKNLDIKNALNFPITVQLMVKKSSRIL